MEYHVSPPTTESLHRLSEYQAQMKECFLCAATIAGSPMCNLNAWFISPNERHYTLHVYKSELAQTILKSSLELMQDNHVRYHSSVYEHHTNIPPSDAVLVETVLLNSEQLSASWQFKRKDEMDFDYTEYRKK